MKNNTFEYVYYFALILIIGIGVYSFISNKVYEDMFLLNDFKFYDYEQSPILFYLRYNNTKTGKILVLYFSQSGNTEAVANIIHNEVGGDIVKLETVQTYPSDYNELVDYAQKEQKQNARPELKTKIDNIEQYDTIFLGYPNWWADMPMPLYTFLDEYDLSGKTIAPFITHGGSGLSGTPNKIKNEEQMATITEGLAVSGSNAKNSQNIVKNWLSKIGF